MVKCYLCENDAVASCADCHKPVCAIHITDSITWGNVPVRKCIPCAKKTKKAIAYFGIIVVVIVVVVLIIVFSTL